MKWPLSRTEAPLRERSGKRIKETPGNKLTYGPGGIMAGNGGYASTRTLSTVDGKSVSGMPMSGERHATYDRGRMVQQSREFYRDNAIFRGMIDRYVAYVVGSGFSLQAQTASPRFNARAEELWGEYWESPEVRGVLSGTQIETLLFRERLIVGDVAALKLRDGTVQIIEGDQISEDNCYSTGIRVNEVTGKPTAYAICPYSDLGYADTGRMEWKDAEHVLFIADPERPSSIRGIPAVQPAFAMLHRINDMCDATAIAAQLLAHFALIVNRKDAAESALIDSIAGTNSGTQNPIIDRVTEFDYATIFHGDEGEEIRGVDHNIPGMNFPDNLKMFMRLLGLPLGIPLEVMMLLWSDSNYSQSRAVMEQFFRTVSAHQKFFSGAFHRPLYRWKVDQWIKEKRFTSTPADKYRHEWMTPAFPWLDPYKEAQAHQLKLQLGITTRAKICKSADIDPDQVLITRSKEITEAIRAAQAIKANTGVAVPWQLLAGVEMTTASSARPKPEPSDSVNKEERPDIKQEEDDAAPSE